MEFTIEKVELNDPKPHIRDCKCGSTATLYTKGTEVNSYIIICDQGINCPASDRMDFRNDTEQAIREWNLNGFSVEFIAGCPFCKDGHGHPHLANNSWHIRCIDCGARTAEFGSREAAKRAWNTRLGVPRIIQPEE